MDIPLVDLKAQYRAIKDEIDNAIQRVLDSTSFILGQEVAGFENEFAAYCGTDYAVGTSSGTSALHTALSALGLSPDEDVIAPALTFIATASEVSHLGAHPVFVDIEPRSFTLDVEKVREKIESDYAFDEEVGSLVNRITRRRLRTIIPVHLYGQMVDMEPLLELASQYHLRVVEDAAQAHGAEYRSASGQWKKAGSLGVIGCFSFYPGKNLGAYGDAGAVITSDAKLSDYMCKYIHHGRSNKSTHLFEGGNHRLDALQAAILRVKLGHLDQWTQSRRRIARLYDELLRGVADITTPEVMSYGRHVHHLYVIRTSRRDELVLRLSERGIGAGVHYPMPLHLQPAYRHLGHRPGDFPVAEACAREVLSLPLYPEMTEQQVEYVINSIKAAFK